MRTGNVGLLLFVLLAAGGVGFLAGRTTAPTAEVGTEVSPDPDRPIPERPPEPPPVAGTTLAEALAAIPAPEIETGDGVITGTVMTEQGEPVEGVLVRATIPRHHQSATAPGEVPADPDLTEAVLEFVREHRRLRATRIEAKTGWNGEFRLTGVADARHMVQAYRTGYRIWTQNWYAEPGGVVKFTARLVATLSFRVLGPDGSEVADATVRAKSPDGSHSASGTPQRPLEVQPGKWIVTAFSARGDAKSEPVTVIAGVETEPVVLRLVEVPGIRGRIVFPEGEAQRHVTVHAIRWGDEALPTATELQRGGRRSDVWARESSGYAFTDLGRGEWVVAIVTDRRVLVSARVTVADRMVVRDLTIPPPDPSDHLVLTILGPGSKPVEGVQISVGIQHANGHSSRGTQPVRLGKGRYRVAKHRDEDEDVYKDPIHYVLVSAHGLGNQEVVYDPDTTRELTVRFDAPATLTIHIPNAEAGWLESRVSVALYPAETSRSSRESASAKVIDDTTVRCGPVPPGKYDLSLSLKVGEHYNLLPLSSTQITLATGKNEHTLNLPSLHRTTLVLPEGGARSSIRITRVGGENSNMGFFVKAKEGRIALPPLPAGTYRVRSYGGRSRGLMEFTLPGPAEIRLASRAMNAMRVWIKDPEGLLAQVGFEDGDLIIGAEGKLFANPLQLSAALMGGAQKDATKLVVLRGGRRIDLTVNLKKLMGAGDHRHMGGNLREATRPE